MIFSRYDASFIVCINPAPPGYVGRKTACYNLIKNIQDIYSHTINEGKANQEQPVFLIETVGDFDYWTINLAVDPDSPGFQGLKTAFENILKEIRDDYGEEGSYCTKHVCNHEIDHLCTGQEDL